MYEPKPTDWIVDWINLSRICHDANWDLGVAIRAAEYAGLAKEDAEAYVRWMFGHHTLTSSRADRVKTRKELTCQNRKP